MSQDTSQEKTEQPTDRRLRDTRKDGQASKSADLANAMATLATIVLLYVAAQAFSGACRTVITLALDYTHGTRDLPTLFSKMAGMGLQAVLVIVPCALAAGLLAVAVLVPQVGFQVAMKPVVPKLDQLNPVEGFKRIFSWHSVIELIKMLVKALVIGEVMWMTIDHILPLVSGSLYQPLAGLSKLFWELLLKLCTAAGVVFLVIGALDVKLQRVLFLRKMRMSKDEVKREHKQDEGDPKIKGERRRLAREMVSTAGSQPRVGLANALIVNPTHYAVAIRYAPHEHPLPLVIAKGADEAAALLRRFAHDAEVPIVGNPPVARALYRVGIDEPIPEELFATVAAILRWVEAIGAKRTADSTAAASAVSPGEGSPC